MAKHSITAEKLETIFQGHYLFKALLFFSLRETLWRLSKDLLFTDDENWVLQCVE